MVRRLTALAAAAVTAGGVATALAVPSAAALARLDGFTAASSAAERTAEQNFLGYPSASLARELDQELSRRTGMVGTPNDKRRMQMIVARLRSFGLQPKVHTYYVYMSSPRTVRVRMTAPVKFTAANKEKCRSVETDCQDVVVGYNALSPSGNVTAPVVYVNYGTTADYATLKRKGVSVRGKIV